MILAALVKRYESQAAAGKISRENWGKADVSFGLRISENGEIADILNLRIEVQRGKKNFLAPRKIEVPEQVKKTANVASNFLCENAAYLLGLDKTSERFEAAKNLHQEILKNCNSAAATAIKNFFANWKPKDAENFPKLKENLDDLKKGSKIIFMFEENFATEDAEIKAAWENYKRSKSDAPLMQCLVTGKVLPIAILHPKIKGVRNANTAGAAIVSFNAPAFESYGKENRKEKGQEKRQKKKQEKGQGLNAPISEYAAFAYATALNDLLSDFDHVKNFGDTTVVYWAEETGEAYQDCFSEFFEPNEEMSNKILNKIMAGVQSNKINFDGTNLNFENPFYILGLSANSGRLSIRFFVEKNFGEVVKNIAKHYDDCKIVKPPFKKFENIPLWQILAATISPKSKDKTASPLMSGAVIRAILTGQNYPASLFQNAILRLKSEHEITYERAAIIKAYLTRNKGRENLMALDENSTDRNYILGRIFSVLEAIQAAANPNLNATIKDKYFTAACAAPNRILPNLQKLSINHLKKLEIGQKIYFEKQLGNLMSKLSPNDTNSKVLTLEEQGIFILGYYHQTQERYKPKEEKENG